MNNTYEYQKEAEGVEESYLFFVQGRLHGSYWEDHVFFNHPDHENGFLTPDMAFEAINEAPKMDGYYSETRVIHRALCEQVVIHKLIDAGF